LNDIYKLDKHITHQRVCCHKILTNKLTHLTTSATVLKIGYLMSSLFVENIVKYGINQHLPNLITRFKYCYQKQIIYQNWKFIYLFEG